MSINRYYRRLEDWRLAAAIFADHPTESPLRCETQYWQGFDG
ncbi:MULTISPECIES: hypothetical protein [Cyanophyceae]|nr:MULTISPECIES: hypothetical protein [unclassified Trichocoleus]